MTHEHKSECRLHWHILGILALLVVACSLLLITICGCDRPPSGPVGPTTIGGAANSGGSSGVGGLQSTGGQLAAGGNSTGPVLTGGAKNTGGRAATGGLVSTGGTATVPTTIAFEEPECAAASKKASRQDIERFRKTLRKKKYEMRKHPRAVYNIVEGLPDCEWFPLAPTLNQRRGSCTANAALQCRISQPWTWPGTTDPEELEDLADDVYSGATKRDPFPGSWPPDDTGSDGASALAELKARGLIAGWTSVLTFEDLQRHLQSGPCIIGTNWYTTMFTPDRCGQVTIGGAVEGGHEWVIKGIQYSKKRILAFNSWGDDYAAKLRGQGGWFWVTFGSLQRLLNEGGEIECPFMTPANDNSLKEAG